MRPAHVPLLALVLGGLGGPGSAQEAESGRRDFVELCAQCHGADGRGGGLLAGFLRVPAPDITLIQRGNDGVFPAGIIHEVIEGGGATAAHGTREMPAWGTRFTASADPAPGHPEEPGAREAAAGARIDALVAYVATLQER